MLSINSNIPINTINFSNKEEDKIIKNVIMAQTGEAKGHGIHVDQEFINTAAAWFNEHMPNGVKANWGHNWENLGRTIGKFHNIKARSLSVVEGGGTQLTGDLHLYDAADLSPELPNVTEYIRKMAAEDAEALMCSLVFTGDHYYQKTSSGQNIKVFYYDEEDNWISSNPELGAVYIAWAEGRSCDLVGDGALTERLFSSDSLADKLHSITNHPQFQAMMQQHGEKFTLLNEYYHKKSDHSILQKIKNFFSKENTMENTNITHQTTSAPAAPETVAVQTTEAPQTSADITAFEKRFDTLEKKLEAMEAEKRNLLEKISDLETQLSEAPAAQHTATGTNRQGAADAPTEKLWMQNPINQVKLR